MIFKNLAALLRQHKRIVLYGDPEELQWVGDGAAVYPLHGMPGMVEEDLQAVFDVPEKDEGKYLIDQQLSLPEAYCYSDLDLRGETQLRPEPWILKRYDTLLVPVQTSRGLRFYNPDYLKPLRDLQNTLEIYERRASDGSLYFAVKSGMLLQAIVLPLAPEYGKILDELLELCEGLQKTVELQPPAASGGEREAGISAAVEKPEDQREPERFFGYRKADDTSSVTADAATPSPQGEGNEIEGQIGMEDEDE